ncbi:PREDICTED: tetraspanin-9-like [Amphimedon queenslandica]|uniref:Tetraspanin n=1 Tax=Amphimedon queenslandica TaxID=400682 RepID=A0A1X7USR9_AMPQE|nr:PREDICTED: tetraspanin-9-like [Amphimedon queenslandica]|eukprot:XP_011404123.1 PREDICTED: tetraspanin-9-like [Amphimedon queenslandica]
MVLQLLLTAINLVFVIVQIIILLFGLVIVGVGTWLELQYKSLKEVLDSSRLNYGPYLIICVGILVSLIGLFGFVGVNGKNAINKYSLGLYIILAFIVVLGQMAGAMATFVFREQVESIASEGLNETMKYYGMNSEVGTLVTDFWNNLQQENGCCGVNGARDWIGEIRNDSVVFPSTCCKNTTDILCGRNSSTITSAYGGGCLSFVTQQLSDNLLHAGAFGLSVVGVQAVAIIVAVIILTFTSTVSEYSK